MQSSPPSQVMAVRRKRPSIVFTGELFPEEPSDKGDDDEVRPRSLLFRVFAKIISVINCAVRRLFTCCRICKNFNKHVSVFFCILNDRN